MCSCLYARFVRHYAVGATLGLGLGLSINPFVPIPRNNFCPRGRGLQLYFYGPLPCSQDDLKTTHFHPF